MNLPILNRRAGAPLAPALLLCAALSGPALADDLDALLFDADRGSAAAAGDGDIDSIELPPEEPAQDARRPNRPMLEEIVVTAQKREQGLSDVPISLTALSGEKLADAGIEDLNDLSEYAPNFKMVDGGLTPMLYMRGVGSGINQGFEMSVAMFNDSIHLGRPFQAQTAFLDVERVEVLKGPQSILFGKNAIAGALNISSAKPQDDFGSRLSLSWFEPAGNGEASGFVTGSISDTLRGRLAGRFRSEGGHLTNLSQERSEIGLSEVAGRGTLAWSATDTLELLLKLERSRREQDGRAYQIVDRGVLDEANGTESVFDDRRDTNRADQGLIDSDIAMLSADWALGEHTLQLISGYSGYDFSDLFDADGSPVESVYLTGLESYRQSSHELRWISPPGERWEVIGGLFYQGSEQAYDEVATLIVRSGTLAASQLPPELLDPGALLGPGALVPVASADLVRDFRSASDAWSAFGQATWFWRPDWRAVIGLRFVSEKKQGLRILALYQPGTRQPLDPASAALFSQLRVEPHRLEAGRQSDSVLPSIVLQHDLNDDVMLYGSWTRGAKSGGFDARNNNAQAGPTGGADNFEFDDEVASAYELGSKLRLLAGAAELNLAAYLVDYADMQVSVFDGVAGFAVTNAGESRVMGAELDGRWLLSDSLMLSGALAYLDFAWLEYGNAPCPFGEEPEDNGNCDFAGRENQQSPEWTASLSGSYMGTAWQGLPWEASLDVNFRDDYFSSGDLDPRGLQQAYTKINARLSIGAADDRWTLALVGKNLTDETTVSISAPVPLDTGGYALASERPRNVGLELRYRFE